MSSSILAKILKVNTDIFSNPLTNIINNGISNSCFDSGLKLVDLTPQGDEMTNKKNYKNVSLLPVVYVLGGYGVGVLMDLSKAFDTLDNDLIAKVHAYGFDKNSFRLITRVVPLKVH